MSPERIDLVKAQGAVFRTGVRSLRWYRQRTREGERLGPEELEDLRQAYSNVSGALIVFGEVLAEITAEVREKR